ncbi:MFS general substrate transporter [Massarina eburnea CBS 473.64]|uniref:MFS general substrate transporter n=1 Tax=Massarina eburnea CBS 473.64 TaxID=1395130 RepID=A0A6A6RSY7_9PLEO|nr:MFS general substrate transporter [Massarina eburnea CBS 473.64]
MEQGATRPMQSTSSKRLSSHDTITKLPWLDAKCSVASSSTTATSPTARRARSTPPPAPKPAPAIVSSPKRSPSAQSIVSASPMSRHPAEALITDEPTIRKAEPTTAPRAPARAAPRVPHNQRVPSVGMTGPRPVTRARANTFRRPPAARSVPTPIRNVHSGRPPVVSHEPMKRLSIVNIEEPSESFQESRARAESLAPVPDHLERAETPESTMRPQRNAYMASPPHIERSVHMSPTYPVPRPGPFTRVSSRKLSNAVEGLEDLVQEAVLTADDTNDPEQVAEIYDIIEDARNLIQETSGEPLQNLMKTSSPLEVTGSSEEVSDFSSELSDEEAHRGAHRSKPRYEPSPQSPRHDHHKRRSETIDWAYGKNKAHRQNRASSTSLSSDLDDRGRSRSRYSTQTDLLLPPEPTQTAPRDHVEVVLRPAIHRHHSRGRSRRRRRSDSELGTRRRHHHRSWHSHESRSRSLRRRRARSSDLSSYDKSFEEADLDAAGKPYGIRRNSNDVRIRDNQHTFSLRRNHRRQPIARNWGTSKKRFTALIACINTALLGIIVGIYAGEVPRIQYVLADERHIVIVGNVVLYAGLAISTFISWPLPLLHGRKPYILASLALAMPLQFPQALVVSMRRSPKDTSFLAGLLVSRAFTGLILGFANVNFITTLLDLFGASLQSKHPHQEFTVASDVRRHGGGMGLWLGIWSWCSIGSLACGFQIGAGIIEGLTPDWGFYIVIIILAAALLLNVMAPETRRSAYRRSVTEVYDRDENYITRRIARGEIKLHISTEGPMYWFEEVWAGIKLSLMMLRQPGFLVLALYVGWIYAQIVLVIILLGALLSRDYRWTPRFVGLGVMSIAIGALLAIPLTKANVFSRERKKGFRTDSMTFQKQVTWSSHLVRRVLFTLALPLMGLAYTVSSAGRPKPFMVPIVFAGTVGFLSILAIAECHGLIMETFDTCDLQPGVNTKHRLQSMAVQDRRRRTNYSSFPRVSAGIFVSQTLAFIGAAIATQVGGIMTRHIGAQASTGVSAGILLGLTVLLTLSLTRFKSVQVIPNHTFGTRRDTEAWNQFKELGKRGDAPASDWKAVVIGNPSGKMRRVSLLELGALSRWTEIRKLNFLLRGEVRGSKKDDWHTGGTW